MNRKTFNEYILEANFRGLFLSELGWNKPKGNSRLLPIVIDDNEYTFTCVAEKNGLQVVITEVDAIPTNSLARRIDAQLRKQAQDYIAIYKASDRNGHHAWIVPVRNVDKRDLVSIEYETPDKADFLIQKLDFITFRHDEKTTIVDVKEGVNRAFAINSEKITKDFYSGFKKEHTAFAKFITGIDDNIAIKENRNKQWYASVMLNRLMFCYFIQKKGFLDGNIDYLRDKLDWVRQEQGKDRFFGSFYKKFLTQLFSDGLNAPKHGKEFVNKFGRIPYLNGGMFDTHPIERDYANIDIADDAFISLFTFFDKWQWHLDTRVTASGRDINPDVLGYIFEQYINDRAAMGAYYTKEDITEYIGRNCILPFLFDEVKRTNNDDGSYFTPEGYVWQTLQNSGDRYIFDAVKKGYEVFNDIPENIRRGIITEAMRHEYSETPIKDLPEDHVPLAELRSDWNTKTPEQLGLPNEIWRETIERLQRCGEILHKIESGEITSINDFITYNLDIRNFAHDLLAHGDSRFISRFYHALQEVTILDPTCGSGAFLFAAMNILEPLYEICIERMQEFNAQNPKLFKKELEEINHRYRSNIQYFIFKSIILRNLYGVDIMAEATEIAKLRLFLKMVAVVDVDYRAENLGLDPLPDIDFNIRCGNTLVGYANKEQLDYDLNHADDILQELANQDFKNEIEEEMLKVVSAYRLFVYKQLHQEGDLTAFKNAKYDLRILLRSLNDKLSHRLHSATAPNMAYEEWLKSHQPFHWLAEFYQIIVGNGGFDVIIGNPPYVTFTDKSLRYKVEYFATYSTKNLFALCAERFTQIINPYSSIGYIIPLSGMSIDGFEPLQKIIYKDGYSWNSYYSGDRNPSELFTGVKIRAGIYLSRKGQNTNSKYVCRYIKYQSAERSILFSKVRYIRYNKEISAPKIPSEIGVSIIDKINAFSDKLNNKFGIGTAIYYHAAPIHWGKCLSDLSKLEENNLNIADSYKPLTLNKKYRDFTFVLLNSTLFFFYWIVYSDCYNLTKKYLNIPIPNIENVTFKKLASLFNKELFDKMQIAEYTYKNRGSVRFAQFFPKQSKSVIDEIDTTLARYYGFTDDELDFIINYDIKYRMGDELNN